jgi:APA family basic amino acid/polyamine antiporter
MMLAGNPDRLSDIAIFTVFLFYGLAFYAVFLLRKNGTDNNHLYKVPLYPVTPMIAILGAIYIVGSTLIYNPVDSLFSIFLSLSGLPVYKMIKSQKTKTTVRKVS